MITVMVLLIEQFFFLFCPINRAVVWFLEYSYASKFTDAMAKSVDPGPEVIKLFSCST